MEIETVNEEGLILFSPKDLSLLKAKKHKYLAKKLNIANDQIRCLYALNKKL